MMPMNSTDQGADERTFGRWTLDRKNFGHFDW